MLCIIGLLVMRADKIIVSVAYAYQIIKKANHDFKRD